MKWIGKLFTCIPKLYNVTSPSFSFSSVLLDQAEGYVRAIQWILHYYYNGVCSWSWFYPHHYAPYVSDIRNFSKLDLSFDLGHPFLPYEQLLGVLPAASKALLPEAYRSLMVSANSPIIEFYPANFQVSFTYTCCNKIFSYFHLCGDIRRTRTANNKNGKLLC